MEKGRLKERDHKCIQRNYLFIKKNIEALDLLDYLFQSEVITLDDKEKISQGKNQRERNECLLVTILNSGPGDAFSHFIKSLETSYKHVKERILVLDEANEEMKSNQTEFEKLKAENEKAAKAIKSQEEEIFRLRKEKEELLASRTFIGEDIQLREILCNVPTCATPLNRVDNTAQLNDVDYNASACAAPVNSDEEETQLKEVFVAGGKESACAASLTDHDLHCRGNHTEMIAEDQFTIEHLPSEYRQKDIFDLTKAIAALTVRLVVKQVSDERPKYFPNTSIPFPLYDKRGKVFFCTGSGRIIDVEENKKSGSCRCVKCINSDSPRNKWWSIRICTSVTVVYDTEEASNTMCLIFEADVNQFTTLKNCEIFWRNVSGNLCFLEVACCDQNLCNEIWLLILHFNTLWKRLHNIYKHLNYKSERLIIVVSCAHGTRKFISIGRGLNLGQFLGLGFNKFIYNAPICNGCSGGPVYALGMNWFKEEYVHSGHEKARDLKDLVAAFKIHVNRERSFWYTWNATGFITSSRWEKKLNSFSKCLPILELYSKQTGLSTIWM